VADPGQQATGLPIVSVVVSVLVARLVGLLVGLLVAGAVPAGMIFHGLILPEGLALKA